MQTKWRVSQNRRADPPLCSGLNGIPTVVRKRLMGRYARLASTGPVEKSAYLMMLHRFCERWKLINQQDAVSTSL